MAQALKKQDPDGVVAEKHGLRKKLHAWWHGYELAPVIDFDAETGVRSRDQKSKAAEADGSWTPARLMLAQQVWGSGALNPLDEDYLYTMIDDWPLTASDRVLEIADSLGAGGRIINGRFGVEVDLCLSGPELAEIASGQFGEEGASGKIDVCDGVLGVFCPEPESYNAVLIRDSLFRLENVDDFLEPVVQALLASGGTMALSDFFAGENAGTQEFARWMELENVPGDSVSEDDVSTLLQANGLTLKAVEDDSALYRSMIRNGWAAYLAGLDAAALSQMQRAVLEREAELWTCCEKALETGAIRHLRIAASAG